MAGLVVTASDGAAGQSVFRLRGELDYATVGTLRTPATEALTTKNWTALILDLADVTFLDSSGLGVLIEIRNAARNHDIRVASSTRRDAVRRVIEIAGLTSILGTTPVASETSFPCCSGRPSAVHRSRIPHVARDSAPRRCARTDIAPCRTSHSSNRT